MNGDIFYRTLRFIFKPIFLLLYRPRIIGAEKIPKDGAVIIAGNHKHALDPILIDICTKRIVRTLAKKDLHDGPFGFVFRGVKAIPVDLHSKENRGALYAAADALNDGHAVNLSPEAKRNYTNELLLPFKFGAVSLSKKTGAPVLPYAIAGNYKLFSGNLTVMFGEPFYAGDDLEASNRQLYNAVADLLRNITDEKILSEKHFTSFDDWSKNGKTS